MSETVDALLLDMLEWIAKEERSYAEVMEAWRTSCPRLPVWEEANERGLVTREMRSRRGVIAVTQAGYAFLKEHAVTA
jgi:hypothetical protein